MAGTDKNQTVFCERCAPLARDLSFDPNARPHPELMSGSCIWDDETHRGWCVHCSQRTRFLFHARHGLTLGQAMRPEVRELWNQARKDFPNWPLFRPERRSTEIADEVKWLVDDMNDRLLDGFDEEELDGPG